MHTAKLNREYALRMSAVGLLMLAVCGWSVYDGHVAWPRENAKLEAARPLLTATNRTAEAWLETGENGLTPLQDAFATKGLTPPKKLIRKLGQLQLPSRVTENREEMRTKLEQQVVELFGHPVYNEHDLMSQNYQAIATRIAGLVLLFIPFSKRSTRYVSDEDGLHGNGFGGDLAYSDIKSIDWRLWQKKGIVDLETPKGRIRLDAWHFAGIKEIVADIEAKRPELNHEKNA